MAEHRFSSSLSRQPHRLFLPLMIGGGISVVLTLFTIGYLTLTTPEPVPDDIYTIMQKAKAKTESEKPATVKMPKRRYRTMQHCFLMELLILPNTAITAFPCPLSATSPAAKAC